MMTVFHNFSDKISLEGSVIADEIERFRVLKSRDVLFNMIMKSLIIICLTLKLRLSAPSTTTATTDWAKWKGSSRYNPSHSASFAEYPKVVAKTSDNDDESRLLVPLNTTDLGELRIVSSLQFTGKFDKSLSRDSMMTRRKNR